ncbi:mediator of RNA polymerase II transcription subunit 19-B isoform X2 [Amia ocellicauda]|uniref:mediator of RNA polymerase II transcription subunit 19-B isoform X2 n=1 Tax=Amia ocellicauda TaxID=2972642 RepID=UPI003464338F
MTEIFSLYGQSDSQGSSALGFGPGKPPAPQPQNQVPMAVQIPPQLGDEGPTLRKPAAMNEPFYLLRELPGMIDSPGSQDGSCLRSLIEKPPVCGNSFSPLTGAMLTGFRLHTGPLPEQYRLMHIQPPKKKSKHKHRHHRPQDPLPPETPSDSDHKKKKKKRDDDPDRKKKKKDKKKKKNRHSPDHPGLPGAQPNSSNNLR